MDLQAEVAYRAERVRFWKDSLDFWSARGERCKADSARVAFTLAYHSARLSEAATRLAVEFGG